MFEGFETLDVLCREGWDRQVGWEFVHVLATAFGRPVAEGDGVHASEVLEAEQQLGITLPAPLREAYLLFGRRSDLTAAQNPLVPPYRLQLDADGMVVFRVECQGCAWWGVSVADFGREDPPVAVNVGDGWGPYTDRLSLALAEMVLFEAMFSGEEGNVDNLEQDDDTPAALNAAYDRLPLPDFPMSSSGGPRSRWFAGPDVLLRDDASTWLWVYGRTPAAVRAVGERLPGDWMMTDPEVEDN